MFDIAIIGGGPAGMSAAIYARRAGLEVCVFEAAFCGGQMVYTPEIENYPGVARANGAELSLSMKEQMLSLGTVLIEKQVSAVSAQGNVYKIFAGKDEYDARTLIIANGANRRKLGVDGEEKYTGRGVSYCAVCDGSLYKGKTVAVVGGGNTATEDALYLSNLCEKVYLIHRRDTLRAQKHLIDAVMKSERIEKLLETRVVKINGEKRVNEIVVEDSGGERTIACDAVFVCIGLKPENAIFADIVDLDDNGYIVAHADCRTSREGVFAAGDTRTTELRQVITAASDGAIAATNAERYIRENF